MKDDKLKILAIIPTGFCFGLQHITVSFFSRFPGYIESHFLLTRWTTGDMEKLLKEKNIPYSFSWLGMFSRKMDWTNIKMSLHALITLPKLYIDFIALQKKNKPDILYFANHHELILLYPLLLFTKRVVVCHIHDPSPVIPFQQKAFKWYDKVVDNYIAISENVRQRTIALGCKPEKIQTIHNGIIIPPKRESGRANDFCDKAAWPQNVFIIGITGQMIEKKGHMDLIEAFKKVYDKNPLARLVIGGKKQEPLYTMLREKISAWKMEKLVYFPGWLPDINFFFKNIDLFVLASRHEEGYGLVVAEAMANKLPVVITESGGAVEIIENYNSGFIVPKADPVSMAVRLYKLSEDARMCIKTGESARERIEQYFDIQKQVIKIAAHLAALKNTGIVRKK